MPFSTSGRPCFAGHVAAKKSLNEPTLVLVIIFENRQLVLEVIAPESSLSFVSNRQ